MAMTEAKEKTKVVASMQTFFVEVRSEMKKIVWPTPQELTQMTFAVFCLVGVLAIYLGVADFALRHLFDFLMGV